MYYFIELAGSVTNIALLSLFILSLPPKQAKRCYDHYYQGFKISDIAQKEGVTAGSISECIKFALSALRERCNFFNFYD